MSEWKEVWNRHEADSSVLSGTDNISKFLELKRANGFDAVGGGLSYDALVGQYRYVKDMLTNRLNKKALYPNGGD